MCPRHPRHDAYNAVLVTRERRPPVPCPADRPNDTLLAHLDIKERKEPPRPPRVQVDRRPPVSDLAMHQGEVVYAAVRPLGIVQVRAGPGRTGTGHVHGPDIRNDRGVAGARVTEPYNPLQRRATRERGHLEDTFETRHRIAVRNLRQCRAVRSGNRLLRNLPLREQFARRFAVV